MALSILCFNFTHRWILNREGMMLVCASLHRMVVVKVVASPCRGRIHPSPSWMPALSLWYLLWQQLSRQTRLEQLGRLDMEHCGVWNMQWVVLRTINDVQWLQKSLFSLSQSLNAARLASLLSSWVRSPVSCARLRAQLGICRVQPV